MIHIAFFNFKLKNLYPVPFSTHGKLFFMKGKYKVLERGYPLNLPFFLIYRPQSLWVGERILLLAFLLSIQCTSKEYSFPRQLVPPPTHLRCESYFSVIPCCFGDWNWCLCVFSFKWEKRKHFRFHFLLSSFEKYMLT